MNFSELKKGNLISRVENYKVESAKVLSIEKHSKEECVLTVKGTEMKKKYTIIIVTHNMQQAARISDNTAFFLLGELVEMGKTR